MSESISGTILRGPALDPLEGRLVIADGEIVAIEETSHNSKQIILPAFVNAHTHIGDSIAKEAGAGLSLDDLVAPPDGLKHQLLRAASDEELIEAMARSLQYMHASGTALFLEFREGGVAGIEAIETALAGMAIEAVVFGRESIDALSRGDGFGASGARDNEFDDARAAARELQKPFAIHAGERDPDDIDPAFELDPDLLVHMVHTQPEQFDWLADTQTPVAVCPRSNLVTGVGVPPVRELLDHTTVALGTDNVMLNSPSMFREMAYTCKLCDVSAREVLQMATINGARAIGIDNWAIEEGTPAALCVLDGTTDNLVGARDPVRAIVRRAGINDVERVVLSGERLYSR